MSATPDAAQVAVVAPEYEWRYLLDKLDQADLDDRVRATLLLWWIP